MRLSRIINNKFIAILAVLFGVVYLFPSEGEDPRRNEIAWALGWFVGALFTWKKKEWAAILLALLAIFCLVDDILLEIPKFHENVASISAESESLASFAPALIVTVMVFETIILGCFFYYGVYTVVAKKV